MSRSPSSVVAREGDPFPRSRKQYSRLAVVSNEADRCKMPARVIDIICRLEGGLPVDAKNMKNPADTSRQLLRHVLATIAYRGGKSMRNAPAGFAEFHASETTRTPGQILAHLGDELDWALSQASGKEKWRVSETLAWDEGVKRFFSGLRALDNYIGSDSALGCTPEKLFQGALADMLTHIGQISMLRRLAGSPVRAENYSVAEIIVARVGSEQTPPSKEFD